MDATISLFFRVSLAVFITVMALVSLIFLAVVIAAVIGDKKERLHYKRMKEEERKRDVVFYDIPKMNMIDYPDCPCNNCQYFDKETHACLKEDKNA